LRLGSKPLLAILGLAAVCAGWSIFWKLASNATQSGLDDWFAMERQAGRVWKCQERSVGGYPFKIEARCSKPTFSGRVAGVHVAGSMGDILASASAFSPNLIVGNASPPLLIQSTPDIGSASITWSGLSVSYRAREGTLQLGMLSIDAPNFEIDSPRFEPIRVSAAAVEARALPSEKGPNVLEVAFDAKDVSAPLIDRLIGDEKPFDLVATATISRLDAISTSSNALPIERWRRAGGQVQLVELNAAKGEIAITSSGTLELDAGHRPRGRFQIDATGLTDLMDKLGIPSSLLALGSLIGGGAPSRPGATRLSINLENGRALIGPVRLPFELPPLY